MYRIVFFKYKVYYIFQIVSSKTAEKRTMLGCGRKPQLPSFLLQQVNSTICPYLHSHHLLPSSFQPHAFQEPTKVTALTY